MAWRAVPLCTLAVAADPGLRMASPEVVEIQRGREVPLGRGFRVEMRRPPAGTEDPMSEGRMAPVALPRKSGDGDFPRAVAEAVPQMLMEADVEG